MTRIRRLYDNDQEVIFYKQIIEPSKFSNQCEKCCKMLLSKDKLDSHRDLDHIDAQEKQGGSQSDNDDSIPDIKECSLCEDKFLTQKNSKLILLNT